MAVLEDVPDEVIRHILLYVPPEDNLASVQGSSRRLTHLANEPLLWRRHCQRCFTHWAPEHAIAEKLAGRAPEVDWKALWRQRRRARALCERLLGEVLDTKVNRLRKLAQICRLGYDAKDYLLEQSGTPDDAADVLARRYWADTALQSIHRGIAIQEWSRYQTPEGARTMRGLDRGLGAFDMFVLHDAPQDMDEIQRELDRLAAEFRAEHEGFAGMNTREKALTLLRWVRLKNLTGMDYPEDNYRNISNCFIGHALFEGRHHSLPVISSAIYCCIAERLGLYAACTAFPSHVHAIVFAPPGETLDGKPHMETSSTRVDDDRMLVDIWKPDIARCERIILDPYGSDAEVPAETLRRRLAEYGWSQPEQVRFFLGHCATPAVVRRAAQNLKASWSRGREMGDELDALRWARRGHRKLNIEAALYSALWATLLTSPVDSPDWDDAMESLLGRFMHSFHEDGWILERYLLPAEADQLNDFPGRIWGPGGFGGFAGGRIDGPLPPGMQPMQRFSFHDVQATLDVVSNIDARQPTVNRRYTQEICERVRYRIGQVFRHRRYGFVSIINGWAYDDIHALPNPHLTPTDEAIEVRQDGHGGPGGQQQSPGGQGAAARRPWQTFYTGLLPSVDRLVVQQENVQIVTDPWLVPDSLIFMAGKFFKRFDPVTCTFESNIREYFPDD